VTLFPRSRLRLFLVEGALIMLLLLRSLFTLFIGKRVELGSFFLSLIWKKLMIDLNEISLVKS
jgi:hypothetical protein